MIVKLIKLLIGLIDYPNKKKIIKFFKKNFNNQKLKIIDIGAHEGETIELFLRNFEIEKIHAFEPNFDLFDRLKKKNNLKNDKIFFYNLGVGLEKEEKNLNIMIESSSSTINEINKNTEYYRRKQKYLSLFQKKKDIFKKKEKIKIVNLSEFVLNKEISIDILKIDTEGYEFNILKGISANDFKKIKFIYFEHHFDLMIKKGYKFQDIDNLLKQNNFVQKYKLKMKFRKSFEYIYRFESSSD